jgi:predicted extracellular nuclease
MGTTYFSLSSGNYSQDWSNTSLITTNDDWSGVANVEGFRGDGLTSSNDVDPRTVLASEATLDVNANQTNPNTFSTGGVTEFEITNPVVALTGSGTADAPYIVFHVDATGRQNVRFQANLRDLDASTDNAAQQIAVQYRLGNTGNWANVPGGYVADATSGPSLATLVTPIDVTLPADANGAAQVQIRVITTNATGNDEWVGVDDIVISSAPAVVGGPGALSIADASIAEGDSGTTSLEFIVSRTGGSAGAVSVDYAVALDGTASAADLTGTLSGTVNFADGELSKSFTVQIVGDTTFEPNETFSVNLSNAQGGATIGTASATGTILNDEVQITLISAVQGAGTATPIAGQTVTVEAIVVGDFQTGDSDTLRDLRGFYLQEETADEDGNALTSEGLFVFSTNIITDAALGDKVRVTGTVSEFQGQTQITASSISIVEAGAVADVKSMAVPIALGTILDVVVDGSGNYVPNLEAYEGMIATFVETLTVNELFQLDRFNEVRLTVGDRPAQYTQLFDPSAAGLDAYLRMIGSNQIIFDDGLNVQNAAILPEADLDNDGDFDTADGFTMGDSITGLTGVLTWTWAGNNASGNSWRVRSVDDSNTFADTGVRLTVRPEVGGELTVASFNVLNFFTTLGNSGLLSGPNGDLAPRGAFDLVEFSRQLDKLANTLVAIDADVLGLIELENEFGSDQNGDGKVAINILVDAMNDLAGSITYAVLDIGRSFVDVSDAISVGVIFKPASVTPVPGSIEILTGSQAELLSGSFTAALFDGPDSNRAPLAATFIDNATGEDFTVAVAHMKSKGGAGTGLNADMNDGAGAFNETRTQGTLAMIEWLSVFADDDLLVLGDFNAYAKEDPIDAMLAGGFINLEDLFAAGGSSYVFDGQTGTLDYAFGNSGVLDDVTGTAIWHINSPEADALDYNLDFGRDPAIFDGSVPFRTSDHDPVLIGLQFALNIVGTDKRDVLEGTEGRDQIRSLAGNADQMTGNGGADDFIFGAETHDGKRENDFILDYEIGMDRIVLETAEVVRYQESHDQVILFLSEDADKIFVRGPGVTFDSLTIIDSGIAFA